MRKQFSDHFTQKFAKNTSAVFLTGDLGFHAFEEMRASMGNRWINAGVAEQNMIMVAAGLAKSGFSAWCYSIASFLTLKTVEQLRNDVSSPNLPIKLVGNGGGYGYGIMGPTHHVHEDVGIMMTLKNFSVFTPSFHEDIPFVLDKMSLDTGPAYLRLQVVPACPIPYPKYKPVRKITSGTKLVVVTLGAIIHEVLKAQSGQENDVELWCVSELPLRLPNELLKSIGRIQKVIIVEEVCEAGGLSQQLAVQLVKHGVTVTQYRTISSGVYRGSGYGSREYHLRSDGLDSIAIQKAIAKLL